MNLQRKCSSTFFKKGNTPWIKGRKIPQASSAAEVEEARPVLRMGLAEFSLVTKTGLDGSSLSTPDCEGRSGNVRLLRPSAATRLADLKDTSFEGTRLVDNARMISTFNQATEHHRRVSPSCLEHLRIADEVKFRLGVEGDTGVCHMQDYHTPVQAVQVIGDQKTRPGPNPAAVNVGLGIGLQDTPMGSTRVWTLLPYAPLSEFAMGKHIGDQLSLQGVLIKYMTTDGDSRSASGVDAALKVLHPMWEVKRLADPGHLGQSQFRRCQRATFSDAMFCCKTRERTRKAHTVFSQDVKARCSLVLKKMMETFAGDLTALKKELPRVLTATIKCYAGDCSNCARYSVVCSGRVNSSWWTRSMFLGTNKISVLNMNESDEHLLQEILKMKLSVEMVDRMKLYTDTQKCEAANRSLSVSLPKNVNYSRNMIGRASSTIHRLNNGPGTSTMSKCAKMGVELCTRVRRSLRQMDAESEYQKQYQKMPAVAKRKLIQHGGRISDLLEYRRKHDSNSDYQKGQLDGVPLHNEHSYS
jgi:hypothetical protein